MANYKVEWKHSALRELEKLPREAVSRIVKTAAELSSNPYPKGVKKLISSEQSYRIRVGVYRVVYDVFKDILVVEIIRVKHRKDVYR